MKIGAKALQKLQYYFSNFVWYTNCEEPPGLITEEILEKLFRSLGISNSSSISLLVFKEHTLESHNLDEGFSYIQMEFIAPEFDDYVKFEYRLNMNPLKMSVSEEHFVEFDGIRHYKKFFYNFENEKWELSGR